MSHATADDDGVNFVNEVGDDADLVRDFGASNYSDEWTLWILKSLANVVNFFFHEEAGSSLKEMGYADVGSMSAVSNTKCVINSDVSKCSKFLCKCWFILLLFFVIAEIFK